MTVSYSVIVVIALKASASYSEGERLLPSRADLRVRRTFSFPMPATTVSPPVLSGAKAIGRAFGVSGKTILRLYASGTLPGVYKLRGRGPNTPPRIARGAVAELRRFLAGSED
jgi:hypothetical protein